MNPSLPITKRAQTLGPSYEQNGAALDGRSMLDTLRHEPEAHDDVQAGNTASFIMTILAGVGGGLVGIPLGEAIAGTHEHWVLAGGGAVLIALSIPLAIVAIADIEDAVNAHNRRAGVRATNMGFDIEFARLDTAPLTRALLADRIWRCLARPIASDLRRDPIEPDVRCRTHGVTKPE